MKRRITEQTYLIDSQAGQLEVELLLQDEPTDKLALLLAPNPVAGDTMHHKVISTLYRFCRDEGMNVARFNYRGVGKSTGVFGYGDGEFCDAKDVLAWALSQTKARHLWLGGFSFGGFVACRLADWLEQDDDMTVLGQAVFAKPKLAKLALIAPSVVRNDCTHLNVPSAKTVVIYGDQDELVSVGALRQFAKDRQICAMEFAGVGHFFHGQLTTLKQALQQHASI